MIKKLLTVAIIAIGGYFILNPPKENYNNNSNQYKKEILNPEYWKEIAQETGLEFQFFEDDDILPLNETILELEVSPTDEYINQLQPYVDYEDVEIPKYYFSISILEDRSTISCEVDYLDTQGDRTNYKTFVFLSPGWEYNKFLNELLNNIQKAIQKLNDISKEEINKWEEYQAQLQEEEEGVYNG